MPTAAMTQSQAYQYMKVICTLQNPKASYFSSETRSSYACVICDRHPCVFNSLLLTCPWELLEDWSVSSSSSLVLDPCTGLPDAALPGSKLPRRRPRAGSRLPCRVRLPCYHDIWACSFLAGQGMHKSILVYSLPSWTHCVLVNDICTARLRALFILLFDLKSCSSIESTVTAYFRTYSGPGLVNQRRNVCIPLYGKVHQKLQCIWELNRQQSSISSSLTAMSQRSVILYASRRR